MEKYNAMATKSPIHLVFSKLFLLGSLSQALDKQQQQLIFIRKDVRLGFRFFNLLPSFTILACGDSEFHRGAINR